MTKKPAKKLLTFTWSVTIKAPTYTTFGKHKNTISSFDSTNPEHVKLARSNAWDDIQQADGKLTNEQDETD